MRGHILVNDSKASTRNRALAAGCIRANATEYIWWEPSQIILIIAISLRCLVVFQLFRVTKDFESLKQWSGPRADLERPAQRGLGPQRHSSI